MMSATTIGLATTKRIAEKPKGSAAHPTKTLVPPLPNTVNTVPMTPKPKTTPLLPPTPASTTAAGGIQGATHANVQRIAAELKTGLVAIANSLSAAKGQLFGISLDNTHKQANIYTGYKPYLSVNALE
jgi:hypothetical protein